jgi:phage baseplate assembly protein W
MDYIPHLALPIRYESGAFVTNEQDTDAEAADCVKAILSFGRYTRFDDPDFGIPDPTFETQPIDTDAIAEAITTYEPRVDAVIETEDKTDGTTTVRVSVTLPTSEDLSTGGALDGGESE